MKTLILLFLFINISCKNTIKNELMNDKINDKKDVNLAIKFDNKKELIANSVIDSVLNCIYKTNKIQQLNKQNKVSILVQEPSETDDNYTFKVGFNRPERFETRFNFLFQKNKPVIFFYDTLEDKLVEIDTWDAE